MKTYNIILFSDKRRRKREGDSTVSYPNQCNTKNNVRSTKILHHHRWSRRIWTRALRMAYRPRSQKHCSYFTFRYNNRLSETVHSALEKRVCQYNCYKIKCNKNRWSQKDNQVSSWTWPCWRDIQSRIGKLLKALSILPNFDILNFKRDRKELEGKVFQIYFI